MGLKYKICALDFDGTMTTKVNYPECGIPCETAFHVMKEYHDRGGKIILWTCRTDKELLDAAKFCAEQGLFLYAVNEHLQEQIDSFKELFPHVVTVDGRKLAADIYIDDKCPYFLKRGCIDWTLVREVLLTEED